MKSLAIAIPDAVIRDRLGEKSAVKGVGSKIEASPDYSRTGVGAGDLEGIVLKDRTSTYHGGSRAGWVTVKDASCDARKAWRIASALMTAHAKGAAE